MSQRRLIAIIWAIGAFAVTLWFWITFTGLYRWAAEWQLDHFGSYEVRLTLFGTLIVLLLPAGFIGGWGPLGAPAPAHPADRAGRAKRNARSIALCGLVALLIGAMAGALGYQRMHSPVTGASLALETGAEPIPPADLVSMTAIARTDLIVGYQETVAGSTNSWIFVPLVARGWHGDAPVRFILRTNQTAWIPRGGAGAEMPHMLTRGSPPFQMTTEPSVLKSGDLPGLVRTEYEKAHISLDPSVRVLSQSSDDVYAPYWMAAAGGGLVGLCLLAAGLIGLVNARKLVSV